MQLVSSLPWKPVPINNFIHITKKYITRIEQLNSVQAICEEAKVMKHCVANYITQSKLHQCSIWSFTKFYKETGEHTKLLTIEVRNNKVAEVGGYRNRGIEDSEVGIIRMWAKKEGLEYTVNRG